jgi:hypothetical protein
MPLLPACGCARATLRHVCTQGLLHAIVYQ